MLRYFATTAVLLLALAAQATPCAAQSSTVTYDDGQDGAGYRAGIRRVLVDWTSASDGSVTITTRKIVGSLIKVVTDPSATAPTDDYDIVITDPEGANVLGASVDDIDNRDTANTEVVYVNLTDGTVKLAEYPVVCDVLTISVTNAGSAKLGQLILYYRP